jgi:hypothetical protein
MLTITAALVAEHERFRAIFDEVEAALPGLDRLEEVQRLARHLEALLRSHAAAEEDLVLLVLDSRPEQKRRCNRFYTEHQEIDGHLTQVGKIASLDHGRALLKTALRVSRAHFGHEERVVFPLIEKITASDTLLRLGNFWLHQRASGAFA